MTVDSKILDGASSFERPSVKNYSQMQQLITLIQD